MDGPAPGLSPTKLERYARQVVPDAVGPGGQGRLLDARVLVVGAGGLGSPALQYLAAAGVGTLGIADDDRVERSNLGRQVIHAADDLGRPKVDSAADFVTALDPDVTVERHDRRVVPDNVSGLVDDYDLVVDASDNFPTRFLLSDACTLAGVSFTHGAVLRFEGQAATFTGEGPCYRCLLPEAPPPASVPSCAEAGVLGVVPGVIGTIQATEALKLLLGIGGVLDGRLVVFDATGLSFEEVSVRQAPDCPVCSGDVGSVAEIAYGDRCRVGSG